MERSTGHGNSYVDSTGTDCDLPYSTACRRVGIAAEKRCTGLAEALKVQLMADSVTGLGVDYAVLACDRSQKVMVVRVLVAYLDSVVVNIAHGEVVFYPANAHGLELQIGHRARRILRERLVYPYADFGILRRITLDQMGA